jgi:hypothetical protein
MRVSSTVKVPDSVESIDDIAAELADGLCAAEFIYDAITELRHDEQLQIYAADGVKVALLTERGRRVLDFDTKILTKIASIIEHTEDGS